jgi:hypothetical protein
VSNLNVRNSTKAFYQNLENLIFEKKFQNEIDLENIKNIIYRDLDDLVASEDEVDLGKKIGAGASSEVYYGNYKFCPCAVKKIKLKLMNSKQLVFSLIN